LHLFDKLRAAYAFKTGVVFDSVSGIDLAAGHKLFEYQCFEPVAGGIKRRGQPGGSCANYYAIVFLSHSVKPFNE
jgi:hypothetical protein